MIAAKDYLVEHGPAAKMPASYPGDWDAWYDRNVPVADSVFADYVAKVKKKEAERAAATTKESPRRGRKRGR